MAQGESTFFRNAKIGVAAVAIGFGIAAVKSHLNQRDFVKDVAAVTDSNSYIFNKVSDCTAVGFTAKQCTESFERAKDVYESIGINVKYPTILNCKDLHQSCVGNHIDVSLSRDGETTLSFNRKPHIYSPTKTPAMEAWIMSADNTNVSLPLYATKNPDMLVLGNGKTFKVSNLPTTHLAPSSS